LLENGVHIYRYKPKFLHAKHMSVDDTLAVVGSSNMDIRSFQLNSEISLVVYDPEVARRMHALEAHGERRRRRKAAADQHQRQDDGGADVARGEARNGTHRSRPDGCAAKSHTRPTDSQSRLCESASRCH